MEGLVSRRAVSIVRSVMQDEPVVAIQGPRAVGKTTLLRQVADELGAEVLDLDDLATRQAVASDPALFVGADPPVCIDEYQHVPELLDAIKAELNVDGSAGRFLLTGSTRHDALPQAAQALTGRLHLVTLLPLSQGELAGHPERFASALLDDPAGLVTPRTSPTTRQQYVERVCAGGFPLAVGRADTARNRWFDDYVTLTLERDVRELSRTRQREKMPALLARLAAQTAQVVSVSKAGADAGLTQNTADEYTRLLEAVFLIHRLPAWGTTLSARSGSSPKLHVVDSGLAARLLRLSAARLAERDATSLQQFGHLLETFVVGELRKQLSWLDGVALIGHWRTHDGVEVDLVVETDDGRVAAVEVKASSRMRGADLRGLELLRDKLGQRFVGGVALYTGGRSYTAADRVHVLPVDRLWAR
ncbi:MAG TPA: ATP-binding protein [Nitriliruptorales bacterium]